MSGRPLKCPHLASVDVTHADIEKAKEISKCSLCESRGPNLWLCVHRGCLQIGCGEVHNDHSTAHNKSNRSHCVHLNLSTLRVWCYLCETEVLLELPDTGSALSCKVPQVYNAPSVPSPAGSITGGHFGGGESAESSDSDISNQEDEGKPRGLTGLQNIGNTCYMNAALQALSNTPPLTQFFLDCGAFVTSRTGTTGSGDKKPGLSRSYHRLIQEMWHSRRPGYVVPSAILYGIRNVHPMFRGYQQHDTQEFLRCFMDQLHEELKEPVVDIYPEKPVPPHDDTQHIRRNSFEDISDEDDEHTGGRGSGGGGNSSQSEAEYETCDSGVSERSSLSDEGERSSSKNRLYSIHRSRSPSPSERGSRLCKPTSAACNRGPSCLPSSAPGPGASRKKHPVKHRSIISDVFDGKLLSSVQCLTCDRISTRVETFQDLSLPIPSRDHIHMLHQGSLTPQKGGLSACSDVYTGDQGWVSWIWEWVRSWFWGPTISLHDCLAAFFSADELKGDNMYSCEKCNLLRNGVKYSKVLELPEVLCIHLKRFRHELMYSSKIGSYVSFPLEGLDMRPYLHKDCVSQVTSYDLMSVICHHGTAGGGHYTCYSLNCISEQWFEFDDQYVTQVSPETVQNCEAYVLFYKKSCDEIGKKRQRAVELIELSSNEPSLDFYVSKQWVNKFNTFSEPGPIDNSDFLCAHGRVQPSKAADMHQLCTILSQPVWEYLYETFGGGPACNFLRACATCQEEQEVLQRRIKQELQEFMQLIKDFQADEGPSVIYAISMSWFRQWQNFVRGKEPEPPGPIDNSSIVTTKNGQPVVKMVSDYAQLSEELWYFFKRIYGGGPEVVFRSPYAGGPAVSCTTASGIGRPCYPGTVSATPDGSLAAAIKARSTDNIDTGLYSSANTAVMGRQTRAQSASSDNTALRSAARNASVHRKQQQQQQSLDTTVDMGTYYQNFLCKHNDFSSGSFGVTITADDPMHPAPVTSEKDSGIILGKELGASDTLYSPVTETIVQNT
ncbi:ubiquitin carboxyl-terminal hydrolase 20 isoform X1 [Schistocerca nitens]|uniref:ubiquitin carboxyl-terminal hydrolase 20 isoform X1 n=1 Tax=Schistocerca nitens TaxID=7011 RepID=UPI002118D7EC|nr:ubiquitin carboxyl-terminal hydrolase 20 isoform X1 [Schistocerca nitens]